MKKLTRLSEQWFYDLLDRGECGVVDFKEQLEDKSLFGKSLKNFAPNYEEMPMQRVGSCSSALSTERRKLMPDLSMMSRRFLR